MKILLLNGSLRGECSSSLKVANAFIKGIVEETGAQVTQVNLKEKRIDHCHGCFVCWKTTPGTCCIHDDMDEIRDLVMESDIIIESFPLYFFGLPSKMKAFMDRMISYVQEFRAMPGDEENHRFLHNMRYPELQKKHLVLVSTCGYETTDQCYDAVQREYDLICGEGRYTLITAPQGGMLSEEGLKAKVERYLTKFTEAGKVYGKEFRLSKEMVEDLAVPMLGHNTFATLINKNWDEPGVGPYGKPI
ncbi:MAG: flavodoxin family protein [Lachnospiraceae bacterium]|nr:flavodoxin family protein [Lachnospiraceae bacterium]